jgi:hypothetical protein
MINDYASSVPIWLREKGRNNNNFADRTTVAFPILRIIPMGFL